MNFKYEVKNEEKIIILSQIKAPSPLLTLYSNSGVLIVESQRGLVNGLMYMNKLNKYYFEDKIQKERGKDNDYNNVKD